MREERRAWLSEQIQAIENAGRLRDRSTIDGGNGRVIARRQQGKRCNLINWGSNDYLGLSRHLQVRNAATKAIRAAGTGAGSARLLSGGLQEHRLLEQQMAAFIGTDDALLLGSGYQANISALPALISRHDTIIIDRLAHASLYDGARMTGARISRFAHNDAQACERALQKSASEQKKMVVIESMYSMDGDCAPVAEIAELCERYGAWLYVDEAHAFGTLGPGGRGLCAEAGVQPDVLMVNCSKALGASGGLILGAHELITWLINTARGFIYSTAPGPAVSAAATRSLRLLRQHVDWPQQLRDQSARLRAALRAQGWQVADDIGPIIPLLVGTEERALNISQQLEALGHYVPAIRPPTVPAGSCRLRLSVTLAHKISDQRKLLAGLKICRELLGL